MRAGGWQLVVVLLIVLLLFGARRLPDLASALGRSLREFRRGVEDGTDGDDDRKDGDGAGTDRER